MNTSMILLSGVVSLLVLLLGAGIVGLFGLWKGLASLTEKIMNQAKICELMHTVNSERIDRIEEFCRYTRHQERKE